MQTSSISLPFILSLSLMLLRWALFFADIQYFSPIYSLSFSDATEVGMFFVDIQYFSPICSHCFSGVTKGSSLILQTSEISLPFTLSGVTEVRSFFVDIQNLFPFFFLW